MAVGVRSVRCEDAGVRENLPTAWKGVVTRWVLLVLFALSLVGTSPALATDGPYPQVTAVLGKCPAFYTYSDDADVCVSQIGEYAGQLYRCKGHHHPQFQVFPWEPRPQRCCRKNWPPDPDGKSRGLCHRWHPKPYHEKVGP